MRRSSVRRRSPGSEASRAIEDEAFSERPAESSEVEARADEPCAEKTPVEDAPPSETAVPSSVRVSSADGTELDKALLRRLSHTDRLAQIGVLAASVAHEINNPAAFILANLSCMHASIDALSGLTALVDEIANDLPPERAARVRDRLSRLGAVGHVADMREMVEDNLAGIRHIAQIVASLRSFARNDHHVATVDIRKVVEAAVHMTAKRIRERARLELELQPVPRFTGEPTRLAQVVMNLLVNALQAIEPGRPSENSITVRTEMRHGQCLVVVEDTGCGMTDDIQQRMFEPFFTTKADGEGTGLGLALCRDIARQHGGQLTCLSFPGAGTRFELVIPLATPALTTSSEDV